METKDSGIRSFHCSVEDCPSNHHPKTRWGRATSESNPLWRTMRLLRCWFLIVRGIPCCVSIFLKGAPKEIKGGMQIQVESNGYQKAEGCRCNGLGYRERNMVSGSWRGLGSHGLKPDAEASSNHGQRHLMLTCRRSARLSLTAVKSKRFHYCLCCSLDE